jgi:hypothetical protein
MPQIAAKEKRVRKPAAHITAHIEECCRRNCLPHIPNAEVGQHRSIKPSPTR